MQRPDGRDGGFDVDAARRVATAAHAGQTDKAGAPYIEHPRRVAELAARLARERSLDDAVQDQVVMVAWLHDVIEDTAVGLEELRAQGAPAPVLAALRLLTHEAEEPYLDYVARLAADPLARLAKLADNLDNSDEARLARLPVEAADRLRRKYADARALLHDETIGGEGTGGGADGVTSWP